MFSFFRKKRQPASLPFTTDIHAHVIPGVDDGATDPANAADIIEGMREWGIKRIIASPHYTLGTFENTPAKLQPAYDALKEELKKRGTDIDISFGGEYRIDDHFMNCLESGEISLMPNQHILIENSFLQEPGNLDRLVFDLQVKGLRPIMAHPERYAYYHNKFGRYQKLHDAGLSFQINLLSIAGAYGKEVEKIAEKLMDAGLVDYVGTDIHNLRHVEIINQYLRTKNAEKHFHTLAGRIRNDRDF